MDPCSLPEWDIDIFRPDPTGVLIARVFFRNVKVTLGIISGDVLDVNDKPISKLGGLCVPLVVPNISEVSHMTFLFRLKDAQSEIGIFLMGHAFTPTGPKAAFTGAWLAHSPGADTPEAVDDIPAGFVLPGSGDTGSSTGSGT
jgi:hypothetical protein